MIFRGGEPLVTPEFEVCISPNDARYIHIQGGKHWRGWFMDVQQAALLRDWLNAHTPKQQPDSATGSQE